MALKHKITKSAYDKLSDEIKEHYAEEADGKSYVIEILGAPEPEDSGALKRAKDREKERADNIQEELDNVTKELETLKKSQTNEDKDVAKVTARWEKKLEAANNDAKAIIDTLKERIGKALISEQAKGIAAQISNAPDLMQDYVAQRLTVEFDADNNPTLKVLKDGKPSDMAIDKLGEEFKADKKYAPLLTGTKARGSGADLGTQPPSPLGGSANSEKPVNLATAPAGTLLERVKQVREAKAGAGQV